MSGTLYLVATPIGNLGDITLRALETLRSVDVIACEDTRHSRGLLTHYDISARLLSYEKFSEKSRSVYLISLLNEGQNVALITDAGTPCISDPGAVLVQAVRAEGIPVVVIPGASAVVSAVSLVGLEGGFTFLGFLPDKNTARRELLSAFRFSPVAVVFYISPHSLTADIRDILDAWGDREAYLVRELTKIYEEVIPSTLTELLSHTPRGEYVLVIMPQTATENALLSMTTEQHLSHYLELGYDKKEAVKLVAAERGIPKNEVYQLALKL